MKKKELKKKILNLHISNAKKDEKIKRQKIEITLLLKQKKKLKEENFYLDTLREYNI